MSRHAAEEGTTNYVRQQEKEQDRTGDKMEKRPRTPSLLFTASQRSRLSAAACFSPALLRCRRFAPSSVFHDFLSAKRFFSPREPSTLAWGWPTLRHVRCPDPVLDRTAFLCFAGGAVGRALNAAADAQVLSLLLLPLPLPLPLRSRLQYYYVM